MAPIRVTVAGACGRMGQEVVRTIIGLSDIRLVGALDRAQVGHDVGEVAGLGVCGVAVSETLEEALSGSSTDVLVDFTRGDVAPTTVIQALGRGVRCVVGTTGISAADLKRMEDAAASSAVLIAPNFALGAVLMMRFAAEAAQYYQWAEIIELHHEKKIDAPSGTALRTAEMMAARQSAFQRVAGETEKVGGARGADCGIRVHSVRLPGLVAHQEVLLGGTGETLTIRHDSMARTSFMPGVMLAIRRIGKAKGLMVGLEHLL
ncbi:MAG: 4-hydroxy-tetrahydrodipicolinate reductase [Armatimonadetes bacterium]|nr:4-hydroxy-tetrahydrodipicolinate reductase [Armatimonadota bacterium]